MSLDATFDGVSASSVGVYVLKADRSALPAMRDNKIEIPGRPGSIIYPTVPGDRKITMSVGIVGEDAVDYQEKMRALSTWLWSQGKKPLVFSDEPDKYWLASVDPTDSIQLERDIEIGQVDIELVADAYAYKTVTESVSWNVGASPTITINNEGTAGTELRFVLTTTASGAANVKLKSGTQLFGLPSFSAGDTLIVDGENKTVTKNGSPWWYNATGDFFPLAPGNNLLECNADGAPVAIEVIWRPRWL